MNFISNLKGLDGQAVRVKPALTDSINSVGMWGSIRVKERAAASGEPRVEVILQFPEMFEQPAHEKIVPLSSAEIETLLVSKMKSGTYELTLTSPLTREIPS